MKSKLCHLLIVLFLLSLSKKANAIQYEIIGLDKTNRFVVQTEIDHCLCDDHEKLKQNLLNTGLFYSVDILKLDETNYRIEVKEKWTTIPIIKFNLGGGTQQTTLGVYDPNFLGHRIELGLQYEQLGKAPSIVFWNKVPRLFESRFFADIQYWNNKRARLKYNPDFDEPILTKALLLQTEKIVLGVGYEWPTDWKLQFLMESNKDRFSTDLISKENLAAVSGQIIPPDADVNQIGFQVDFGSLKFDRDLQIGNVLSVQAKVGLPKSGDQFSTIKAELRSYSYFYQDWIFAQRLKLGFTDTSILQYWNYLGGLDSIRGFLDNRFATRTYWLSNSEVRKFVFERPNWVLQGIAFVDLLGMDESKRKIENVTGASTGIGFRVIMPKIYRLVFRFDFAKPIVNQDSENISFGIQQFF